MLLTAQPTVLHHPKSKTHHVQSSSKGRKSPTEARTLLPMTGLSVTPGTNGGNGSVQVPLNSVAVTPIPTNSFPTNPVVTNQSAQTQSPGDANVIRLIPSDLPQTGQPGNPGVPQVVSPSPQPSGNTYKAPTGTNHKIKFVKEVYFDAGDQDFIGSFTTFVARAGLRCDQHEVHVYFRNETLDTRGTNLAYTSVIQGSSVGVDYRFWFIPNHAFFTVSDGRYLSGPNKNLNDPRAGVVGEFGWGRPYARDTGKLGTFTDIYTDAFYVDLVKDTFFSGRFRSGIVPFENNMGEVQAYGVLQAFASGTGTNGSENRIESGLGLGYLFLQKHVSLNVEMRGGYSFRGSINRRTYLNPLVILSGSFN